MRRLFFWTTILSGALAAHLMLKRGESVGTVVSKTTTNPIGSLVNELKPS